MPRLAFLIEWPEISPLAFLIEWPEISPLAFLIEWPETSPLAFFIEWPEEYLSIPVPGRLTKTLKSSEN